ncbi:MAG: phosphatase PAP2 family protein [Oscillospiraceae bacterium]|nr:phosphatase PAP2 family protein [Oscillospiraceae bacterium]
MVDYRRLRPNNLTSPEFRHLFLLLFWIAFGICFASAERLIPRAVWHPVWCPLDDKIPFCEWFFIPYMFWFVFLVGMHLYLLLFDIPAFRRFMYFIMVTYSVTMVVYILYPTCQELRPAVFPRDNFLTRHVAGFYEFDTNTNVCPSLHCVGSMAVAFAAWDTERFRKPGWKFAFTATALLISVSTVFVKQHSVIDVLWAWLLCGAAYVIVYVILPKKQNAEVRPWHEEATT